MKLFITTIILMPASLAGLSLRYSFYSFSFFSLLICMQTNFTDFREAPEDILVAVYSAIARNDVANAGIVYLFLLCVLFFNIVFFKLLEAVKKLLATLANRSAICKWFSQMSIVSIYSFLHSLSYCVYVRVLSFLLMS